MKRLGKGRREAPVRSRGGGERTAGMPANADGAVSRTVSRPDLLVDGSDRKFRALVHDLFSFFSSHSTIRDGHARFIGLAGIEYTVLISIAHLSSEGDVNVSTVAGHLHLTGAFITNVCQRLQALGLITKEVDPKDRRKVTLAVSQAGQERLTQLAPVQRQINDVEFGCLSREEFEILGDLISRLVESGEKAVSLQSYLNSLSKSERTGSSR